MKATTIKSTLDLKRVVFDGDMRLRNELSNLERKLDEMPPPEFPGELPPDMLTEALAPRPHIGSGRAEMLKTSFKLSRGLAPVVWRAVDRCTEFLGVTQPIEVYVMPSPEANAFVIPPEKGRVIMGITSSCIERLEPLELVSVVGHELGHVIFDHHGMSRMLEFQYDERITPADAMKMYAWMRYAELTADRVGLLCCDDYDACLSAEFKLVSGLCDPKHIGDLKEVAKQFTSLTKEKMEENEMDWLATHPYAPLRIRALGLFWSSTTYSSLRGRSGGSVGEKELEGEIETMMSLMNPSCLDEKAPRKEEVRELLALGGLSVALADKRLDDLEMKKLARLTGDNSLAPGMEAELKSSRKARNARLVELCRRSREHLPLLRRRKIVEDLCAIALADNEVAETEITVLTTIASLLGVDPMDVDAALGRAEMPLD
jgi:uncharacterized tellurite resistance protein B-like protein